MEPILTYYMYVIISVYTLIHINVYTICKVVLAKLNRYIILCPEIDNRMLCKYTKLSSLSSLCIFLSLEYKKKYYTTIYICQIPLFNCFYIHIFTYAHTHQSQKSVFSVSAPALNTRGSCSNIILNYISINLKL